LDAVGTAQECMNNIKTKNLKALVLKLDLHKAYDCVNWDYLRLILLRTDMGLLVTNWIMRCVTTTSFGIMLNGESTTFFNSGRGLRQGCPLSPLLFILVMEGLSLMLKQAQVEGKIIEVNTLRLLKCILLLFLDYVLIMSRARVSD